jgi:thioredoxin-dependent peroxiredoxin
MKVGMEAPDFTLPSNKDTHFTLSKLRGHKIVVLYFYPKDETIGCTKEACSFRDNYTQFEEMGAEVVGISSDSVESHRSFAENHRLPFTLLSDQKKQVRKLYGVNGKLSLFPGRVTFIIDKKGLVRHIFSSQIQPTKHIQEALQILKQIDIKADNPTLTHQLQNENRS